MGASPFECQSEGTTVSDAYSKAVEDALHWYGHAGYTGTIAEKDGFTEYVVADDRANEVVGLLERAAEKSWDERPSLELEALGAIVGHDTARRMVDVYNDKWGPAVAIKIAPGQWHFCGYAST